jgi:glycosyltransferase involved in cell wall biosynthesis
MLHTLQTSRTVEIYQPGRHLARQMRILAVSSGVSCGVGRRHSLAGLSAQLRRHEHSTVRVVHAEDGAGTGERDACCQEEQGADHCMRLALDSFSGISALRSAVKAGEFDVVYASGDPALFASRCAVAGFGEHPVLVAERLSGLETPASWLGRASLRSRRIDAIVVDSLTGRDELMSLGLSAERIHVLARGIDTQQYRPRNTFEKTRARLGIDACAPLVCATSNPLDNSLPGRFLTAFSMIRQRIHGAKAVVIGPGDKTQFGAELERLGIIHHVTFLTPGEELCDVVSAADVSVCLGDDGTGTPLARMMACARPIVSRIAVDPLELIRHGQNGFLIPENDAIAMAAAIAWMIQNPDLADELGSQARKRVENVFSDQTRAFNIERLLFDLLAEREGEL